MSSPHPPIKGNWLLPIIGVGKLLKAAVLFGAAYAVRYLRHQSDIGNTLREWARTIHQDPDGYHLRKLIDHATSADARHVHLAGIVLFVYAVLFSIEGTGLILRKRWGEYATVLITSLLLPLEVYELFRPTHHTSKVILLVLNLAILAYLIWNLYRTRERATPPTLQCVYDVEIPA